MKRSAVISTIILIFGVCTQVVAEEESVNYSGDLWSRSTLMGDWGGLRNDLAKKGVTLDLNLTQIVQGDIGGGKRTGWQYGGRGDLMLNVDTQKLGWWPGGSFMVEVEGNFGNSVNSYTGALMQVDANQIFPTTSSNEVNMPAVMFTQFFSNYVGVFLGKLDTMDGDANEFAHGKGDTQFFNLAFNNNPVSLLTPYSTLGAGVIILPTADADAATISVSVTDADGQANSSGFNTVFDDNTIYSIEGRVRTDFLGLTGHQLVGGFYSSKDYTSLNQNLRFIVANGAIEQKDYTWAVYYNFDQYLYEPKKGSGQGWGIFGRFGASDGDPNPVHYFISIGVGGRGVIPGRPLDGFGLGYYYINISQITFTGPIQTRTALGDEQVFEGYYNYAITPWMTLTPDIQVINPAQQRLIDFSTRDVLGRPIPVIVKDHIGTATVLGFRLRIVF
ncbi:MAG TPA: carbohydrate porin [Nitrospirota bacterium]|nr:carbohydrate porin [Nitrospirota bacterium]